MQSINVNAMPYFAVDGPDGVGKSTWIKKFREYLELKGFMVQLIREPGHTNVGQMIRQKIFDNPGEDYAIELFMLDRVFTQQTVTKPKLKEGYVVLSDRSVMSSLVYQGFVNNRFSDILNRHRAMQDFLWPSLVFVPTLPLDEALKRISGREKGPGKENDNYLEELSTKNHQKFQHIYDESKNWAPFPIHPVDLMENDELSFEKAFTAIEPILKRLSSKEKK